MTMPQATHPYTGLVGDMADLLAEVESHQHHGMGWDNTPPTLYGVIAAPGRSWALLAFELGDHGPPAAELELLASGLETGELPPFPGAPVAFFLIAEGWGRVASTIEEGDPRQFADIPGSIEARYAIGVVGDLTITVCRLRGEEPVFMTEDEWSFGGDMIGALRRIHAAAARDTNATPQAVPE